MRKLMGVLIAGALLAAPSGADAALSAARAEQEAAKAVAPQKAESIACFGTSFSPRDKAKRVERRLCVVNVPAAQGETCIVTVQVTARSRPRRVSARVIIPQRCFATPAAVPARAGEGES